MLQVLTIASSDKWSWGGHSGRFKNICRNGCLGTSVIVALTAQNTKEVRAVSAVDVTFIADQLDVIFEDFDIKAIKIGMLFDESIIDIVSNKLQQYNAQNIVLDPVMVSKSGAKLLKDSAINMMKEKLIPISTVVTPNIPEAIELTGTRIEKR